MIRALILALASWVGRKLDEVIAADPAAGDEQGSMGLAAVFVLAWFGFLIYVGSLLLVGEYP